MLWRYNKNVFLITVFIYINTNNLQKIKIKSVWSVKNLAAQFFLKDHMYSKKLKERGEVGMSLVLPVPCKY